MEQITEEVLRHGVSVKVMFLIIILFGGAVIWFLYRELKIAKSRNDVLMKGFYKQTARMTSAVENMGNELSGVKDETVNTGIAIDNLGTTMQENTKTIVGELQGINKNILDVLTGIMRKNSST